MLTNDFVISVRTSDTWITPCNEILHYNMYRISKCSCMFTFHFSSLFFFFIRNHLWHGQGEWVGCREYWFWVSGIKRWQILMFFINLKLQKMFVSPQPDVRLRWGLDQNVAFYMDKYFMLKYWNWILLTCDSFPLIMSHFWKFLFRFIFFWEWNINST